MTNPSGRLVSLVALDANGDPRPLLIDVDGAIEVVDVGSLAAGVPSTVATGNLATGHGLDASGNPRPFLVDGDGKLIISGAGGECTVNAASVYYAGDQIDTRGGVWTIVPHNHEWYDVGGHYNTVTHEYTCAVAGAFGISAEFCLYNERGAGINEFFLGIAKNGVIVASNSRFIAARARNAIYCGTVIVVAIGDKLCVKSNSDGAWYNVEKNTAIACYVQTA